MVRRHRAAGGAALLELVLVTPIMVLLFAGISELGWAIHQQDVLTRATRDGVRYLAGQAANASVGLVIIDTTLANRTRNLVVFGNVNGAGDPQLPGLTTAGVTVSSPDATHVLVHASWDYQPLFTVLPFLPGAQTAFQFHSSAVMTAL